VEQEGARVFKALEMYFGGLEGSGAGRRKTHQPGYRDRREKNDGQVALVGGSGKVMGHRNV